MSDTLDATDRIVAATLAGSKCAASGKIGTEDYIRSYEEFLTALREKKAIAAENESQEDVSLWSKLAD